MCMATSNSNDFSKYEIKELIKETPLPSADECYEIQKEKRYVIVDKATGNVVEDAQGYGFKSKQGAWKALYFNLNKAKIKENAIKIRNWWLSHKDVDKLLERAMEYDAEDYYQLSEEERKSIETGERYIDLVQEYIDTHNIKCDISIKNLVKYRDSSMKLAKKRR